MKKKANFFALLRKHVLFSFVGQVAESGLLEDGVLVLHLSTLTFFDTLLYDSWDLTLRMGLKWGRLVSLGAQRFFNYAQSKNSYGKLFNVTFNRAS